VRLHKLIIHASENEDEVLAPSTRTEVVPGFIHLRHLLPLLFTFAKRIKAGLRTF